MTIDDYLRALYNLLPQPRPERAAAVAEVEDHLRASATDLVADVGPGHADEVAIARLGSLESVAAGLAADYSVRAARRIGLTLMTALLACLVVSCATGNGPFFTGHVDYPAVTLAVFLLSQLSWALVLLCVLRCWVLQNSPEVSASDLALIVRGGVLAIASLAVPPTTVLVTEIVSPSGGGQLVFGLVVLVALTVLVGVLVVNASRRVRLAGALVRAAEPSGPSIDALVFTRRLPGWVATVLSGDHHTHRLAVAVALAGVLLAYAVGSMRDGLWPSLSASGGWGSAEAGMLAAAAELTLIVLTYRVAGSSLGLRQRKLREEGSR